jgi:hypothetical protein
MPAGPNWPKPAARLWMLESSAVRKRVLDQKSNHRATAQAKFETRQRREERAATIGRKMTEEFDIGAMKTKSTASKN